LNKNDNQCYLQDPDWKYLGCFKDQNERALPKRVKPDLYQSTEQCQLKCSSEGYRLAGLQWKGACFCGNGFDTQR